MAFSGEGTGVFAGLFLHRISSNQTFFFFPPNSGKRAHTLLLLLTCQELVSICHSISYVGAIPKMIPTPDANIQVPVFPLSSHVMWTFFHTYQSVT